jgi:DNA-binding transcriptional MerR regulator
MTPAKPLKVGQVAAEAKVGVQTLHYYERLGLLPRSNRSEANYRLYSPEAFVASDLLRRRKHWG